MADRAAGGRARYAVAARDVAGDAAHDRAFRTAFGLRGTVGECQRCGESEGGECLFQLRLLVSDECAISE
jgi:hypothetical protein